MNNAPIRIGYSLSLSGPVAENTKTARLTHQIWEQSINDRGGLLDRKVELICIDDEGDALKAASIAANARRFCFWNVEPYSHQQ